MPHFMPSCLHLLHQANDNIICCKRKEEEEAQLLGKDQFQSLNMQIARIGARMQANANCCGDV